MTQNFIFKRHGTSFYLTELILQTRNFIFKRHGTLNVTEGPLFYNVTELVLTSHKFIIKRHGTLSLNVTELYSYNVTEPRSTLE
jgi:hypothetical protein